MKSETLITETIRSAISHAGMSRYRLCQIAKVDQGQLSRFVRRQGWLGPDTLDRLCSALGLQLVVLPKGKGE